MKATQYFDGKPTNLAEDKWIDDPKSEHTYVKGATDAKSYENLLLKNDAYNIVMVIEYNTTQL
jgi:hypothetical protein